MKRLIILIFIFNSVFVFSQNTHFRKAKVGPDNPNILWIYIEDTNAWMSCYGDKTISTPNIDELASKGVLFDRAYMTSGVCSPTRSGIITGMFQTSIGAHEHYSSFSMWRGDTMEIWDPNHLGVRTIPEIFKSAGYYTFNQGKEHYNFVYESDKLYDKSDKRMNFQGAVNGSEWSDCPEGQPFFGQIQLIGGKFRNAPEVVKPEDVEVMPYYPDHPSIRKNIAKHYNTILKLDEMLGEIIGKLKEDGHYENTVVFFFSDHGCDLPRHKQFLYEGGIRVPLIVSGPRIAESEIRKDLVSSLDISATSLAIAGIDIPNNLHGNNFFSENFERDFVVAARDRCDYSIDRIRTVVTERYKYIRNFMTDKPYMQPQYRDDREYMKVCRRLYAEGKLDEVQSKLWSENRPAEELYDLVNDPYETNNLVHSFEREHQMELAKHRDILYKWILETDDQGRFPETDEALNAVIDRWEDKAVNKEYKRVRN